MVANEKILFARRRLEEVHGLEIVEDLSWDNDEEVWYLLVKIQADEVQVENFPEKTMWYMVFKNSYPECDIRVYPALDGGIEKTFNHQNNNGKTHANGLWRLGKLCLSNPFKCIVGSDEPDTYEDKLYWNACRAVEWVNNAAHNNLIKKGDYYEKPDFNINGLMQILYSEDDVSIMEWEDSNLRFGYVDLIYDDNNQFYSSNFYKGQEIVKRTQWGKHICKYEKSIVGAWILLNEEIVINGWQAPNTFGELVSALKNQGVDINCILSELSSRFRDGKRHILMLGFPVPKKIGYDRCIMHWESFLLPVLSYNEKTRRGYRANENGWRKRDFYEILVPNLELDWMITKNWNSKEILNRGRFSDCVLRKRILLLGGGTLGASIGENLIRGGVYNLTVMDADTYSIGNSARHVLSFDSVGKSKAFELAKHYNIINPNAEVEAIDDGLSKENISIIEKYDVIIDCTANNNVLSLLKKYETQKDKIYISVSFGYNAAILYFSYQKGNSFDLDKYCKHFLDKMKENKALIDFDDLPWEGTGCWSPVFPAMASDVQLVAAFATGIVKTLTESDLDGERYFIYQKDVDEDGVIKGFARI